MVFVMPRDKKGKAPNPLADMFNIQMPEDDEAALEAELAALQGIAPKRGVFYNTESTQSI